MGWIKTILTEVYGLFVDDGSFAVAILAWLGLFALLAHYSGLSPRLGGAVLFAGLVAILLESALRRARR